MKETPQQYTQRILSHSQGQEPLKIRRYAEKTSAPLGPSDRFETPQAPGPGQMVYR